MTQLASNLLLQIEQVLGLFGITRLALKGLTPCKQSTLIYSSRLIY
ncbi:hypothetical protein PPEP_b0569 [Pseudoalteromonas peptidolytica F12-50-A1]|uniref:Uncharacterized protein n=1 Tax=Pseudoalteromonas peptidolytica F12-50-A1 TaxID=1315280 RepID=A0A8I0MZ69_9GAMM|nr:hypothetical protein [Pseudoalteromonas peptidolytica F12-50-A1]